MKKSFTLVEIMIVVVIIAILAGIAIPNLLRSRLISNEHCAISNLQTISAVAQTYWSVENFLPDVPSKLHDGGYIDEILGSQGGTKNGYKYYMGGIGTEDSFYVYTVPEMPDVTGIRSFCAVSDGVIRVSFSGATPASQAACIAWDSL